LRTPDDDRYDRRAGAVGQVRRPELALGERAGVAARPLDGDGKAVPILEHVERLLQRTAVGLAAVDEDRPRDTQNRAEDVVLVLLRCQHPRGTRDNGPCGDVEVMQVVRDQDHRPFLRYHFLTLYV